MIAFFLHLTRQLRILLDAQFGIIMVGHSINKVDCLHRLDVDILRRRARAIIVSTLSRYARSLLGFPTSLAFHPGFLS